MDPDGHRDGQALRVLVGDEQGRRLPRAAGLVRWLKTVAPARARGTVSVAVVSDARVRSLNRQYRGVDHATDVLSFPSDTDSRRAVRGRGKRRAAPRSRLSAGVSLGDIVIARGVARRQARDAGHAEAIEWRVLALHGLLHLLGYDHESDDGRMERLERRLRRRGGLPAGLIERAARS